MMVRLPIFKPDSTASLSRARMPGFEAEPINHDFDIVALLTVQLDVVGQRSDLAINTDSGKSLLEQIDKKVSMLTLLGTNDGRQDRVLGSLGQQQDAANDLIPRLCRDRLVTLGTESLTRSRKQDPQKIVYLGHRPDGASRVIARRFLRNRNRGTEARNQVNIGFGHLAQELSSKTRKAFDIPTLPFCKEGIECK